MTSVTGSCLLDRAAAGFAGIDVTAVAAVGAVGEVGELVAVGDVVDVDAVAEFVIGEFVEAGGEDTADDDAEGDVGDVIVEAAAVGEAGGVTGEPSVQSRAWTESNRTAEPNLLARTVAFPRKS